MLISCSRKVKVELSRILSYLMFVTPISLPLEPISRSTAVVLFSLLESMGAIFGRLSTCLCKLAFFTNSTIYFCISTQKL